MSESLAPCICGTRNPPFIWRKYSRSSGTRYRCPSCKRAPPLASSERTGGPGPAAIWNEYIKKEREQRAEERSQASVLPWPPVPGHYATTLVKNGPRVPVRIWFGRPVIDGEEQDRSPRWLVEVDGQTDRWEKDDDTGYCCRVLLDVDRYWPYVAREPITPREYDFLIRHARWAKDHQPSHPKANPRKAVDFNTLAMRF